MSLRQRVAKSILSLVGWKVTGPYPYDVPKKVMVVAPHTSNWDFPLGLLAREVLGDWVQFVGKASLFKPPYGWLMKALGGIPVERSKSTNFVMSVVKEFEKREKLTILFAAEGTRKRVDKLKTGYYYVARQASVPLVFFRFDHAKKEMYFSEAFYLTDDASADQAYVEDYFRGIQGRIPENGFGWNS